MSRKDTKNKGEWFELQCLFSLLRGGPIQSLKGTSRPCVEWIERYDGNEGELRRYYPLDDQSRIIVMDPATGQVILSVVMTDFDEKLRMMEEEIWEGIGRSFKSNVAVELMIKFGIGRVKASAANKADLIIKFVGCPEAGYSVKAEGCGAPSLLNAGKNTTRFKFRVDLDGDAHVDKRGKALFGSLAGMHYVDMSKTFRENMGTDTARMVAASLSYYVRSLGMSSVKEITERLGNKKTLKFNIYSWVRRMKDFLHMCAVEGTPGKQITRGHKASGGIVFLFPGGILRVLTFRDTDDLKDYLYENSMFDLPDMKRHDYGVIYEKNGRHYVDVVLGIRLRIHSIGVKI
jgi:type II restriction enzyme